VQRRASACRCVIFHTDLPLTGPAATTFLKTFLSIGAIASSIATDA
jgi:hypothetical protein